ncbi:hypothetical protein ElyMa_004024900 [Elysia marginata]|uniref:Uncharacterized protein n=1 Tax=Elysia marginata TaxID=1093978 RepID=A0AAV4G1Z4_9GAST|nr:hypothetical protein ElyMa_004024900 [Elysia marginata]
MCRNSQILSLIAIKYQQCNFKPKYSTLGNSNLCSLVVVASAIVGIVVVVVVGVVAAVVVVASRFPGHPGIPGIS